MWQRKSLAIIFAAALAGCVSPQMGMQGYYGGSTYYGATSISFGYFYDELAPYGRWYNHPRWGDVWHPTRVEADFRPYYRGHWVNTVEYGWTWYSDYPWSDAPFHYGRWVFDPYDGWLWVPGYVWAPAWVVWRSGGGSVGWFPMPPDDRFLAGYDVYRTDWDWNRGFGYRDWYGPTFALEALLAAWVFIDYAHFGDRDYYNYVRPRSQHVTIINNTTNVTNYITINNRIVNRSINVDEVERATGRRIERVMAREVVKAPVTTVDVGRQVDGRERRDHGGNVNASARERVRPLAASEATPAEDRRTAPGQDQRRAPGEDQRGAAERPGPAQPAQRGTAPRAGQREVTRPEGPAASARRGTPAEEQRGSRAERAEPAVETRQDRATAGRPERVRQEQPASEEADREGDDANGRQTDTRRSGRSEDAAERARQREDEERERRDAARVREN